MSTNQNDKINRDNPGDQVNQRTNQDLNGENDSKADRKNPEINPEHLDERDIKRQPGNYGDNTKSRKEYSEEDPTNEKRNPDFDSLPNERRTNDSNP